MIQGRRFRTGEGTLLLKMVDFMCWSVQGLNYLRKQKYVKKFLKIKSLGMVSLIKTKVKANDMGITYKTVFMGWCFCSNNTRHPGGRLTVA